MHNYFKMNTCFKLILKKDTPAHHLRPPSKFPCPYRPNGRIQKSLGNLVSLPCLSLKYSSAPAKLGLFISPKLPYLHPPPCFFSRLPGLESPHSSSPPVGILPIFQGSAQIPPPKSLPSSPGRTFWSLPRDFRVFIHASNYDTYMFFLQVYCLGVSCLQPSFTPATRVIFQKYQSDCHSPASNPSTASCCWQDQSWAQLPGFYHIFHCMEQCPLPPKSMHFHTLHVTLLRQLLCLECSISPFYTVNTDSSFKILFKYPLLYKSFPNYFLHSAPSHIGIVLYPLPASSRLLLHNLLPFMHLSAYSSKSPIKLQILELREYILSPEPSTGPDMTQELSVCLLTTWVQKWWVSGSRKEQMSKQMNECLY